MEDWNAVFDIWLVSVSALFSKCEFEIEVMVSYPFKSSNEIDETSSGSGSATEGL